MEKYSRIIKKESLGTLYKWLGENYLIYAPVAGTGGKTVYKYNPGFGDVSADHIRSVLSVKNVVFPKVENLFRFNSSKTETKIDEIDTGKIPQVVLWGSHPCDNAAFDVLKSIFCWDSDDKFFSERLSKLVVIGFSCFKSDEFCFCTSTGLSPDSEKGSDILLTLTDSGNFKADILTEKGHIISEACRELFSEYNGEKVVVTQVKAKFSSSQVTEKLAASFEHPFWIENSLRCIGCGACAYVCPACACFDIQDETRGKEGKRYRCWDSCGFGLFTLHTSGHNPRHVQSQRWRQRIMHKFSYMPERNDSLGCVGCGRCSAACPVDMNIAEQLEQIQNL